jgi:hypothetical protein
MAILRGRDANGTTGARGGDRHGRGSGRAGAHASRGGSVGRPARRLIRLLDPSDKLTDLSP